MVYLIYQRRGPHVLGNGFAIDAKNILYTFWGTNSFDPRIFKIKFIFSLAPISSLFQIELKTVRFKKHNNNSIKEKLVHFLIYLCWTFTTNKMVNVNLIYLPNKITLSLAQRFIVKVNNTIDTKENETPKNSFLEKK